MEDDMLDELLSVASRARALDDHGAHERALEDFTVVLADARGMGIASPSLLAAGARAALNTGRLELAVGLAEEALRADPLCVPAVEVLDGAAARVGALIAEPDRRLDSHEMPGLYKLLVRAHRTDAGSALALARHHEAHGSRAVARALREFAGTRAA